MNLYIKFKKYKGGAPGPKREQLVGEPYYITRLVDKSFRVSFQGHALVGTISTSHLVLNALLITLYWLLTRAWVQTLNAHIITIMHPTTSVVIGSRH